MELADEYKRVADMLRSKEAFIAREVRANEISISNIPASGDLVKDWDVDRC